MGKQQSKSTPSLDPKINDFNQTSIEEITANNLISEKAGYIEMEELCGHDKIYLNQDLDNDTHEPQKIDGSDILFLMIKLLNLNNSF